MIGWGSDRREREALRSNQVKPERKTNEKESMQQVYSFFLLYLYSLFFTVYYPPLRSHSCLLCDSPLLPFPTQSPPLSASFAPPPPHHDEKEQRQQQQRQQETQQQQQQPAVEEQQQQVLQPTEARVIVGEKQQNSSSVGDQGGVNLEAEGMEGSSSSCSLTTTCSRCTLVNIASLASPGSSRSSRSSRSRRGESSKRSVGLAAPVGLCLPSVCDMCGARLP